MNKARTRRLPAGGFTLLEVLVALVVLGFLIVGLSEYMRVGVQAWDRQRRMLDATGEFDAVDRTLRSLIEQMDPGAPYDPADIVGTSRTLRFTTLLPQGASTLPTRRTDVMLLVDPAQRLLLRWTPKLHAEPLRPVPPVETVLVDGIDHIDIEYETAAPAAGWERAWDSPTLPLLVRIHIAFPAADPRHWPDLVAAPMRERAGR